MRRRAALLESMFQTYGNPITVYPKNKKEYLVNGLIRPLSFQKLPVSNELNVPFDDTEEGGYYYLGSCKYRIDRELKGTKLELDDVLYLIVRSRAVYLQNEPLYISAVLQKVVES